jgi:tetratricopeptide (TPR) repeat protein
MKKFRSVCAGVFAVVAGVSVQTSALAGDSPTFKEGMDHYVNHRYHAASQSFVKAIAKEPNNAKIHYYLGSCFEALRDPDSAKSEYEMAFQINPFDDQGHQARAALMHLSGSVEAQKHPTDGPAVTQQALRMINEQAADNKGRWMQWGQDKFNYRMNLGQIEVRRNENDPNLTMSAMTRRGLSGRNDMSNRLAIRNSYTLTDAQVQANKYMLDATKAAAFTQQSANTLKQLLGEKPQPGQIHLRALGTSLYVRNYSDYDDGDLPPADPPIEMKATQKSFSDLPKEMHATPAKL